MIFPDMSELRRMEREQARRLDELIEKELQEEEEEKIKLSFCIHTPKESMTQLGGEAENYHL